MLGVARSFPWVVREREREFQPYFFFFFVRFSGSDVKSRVTGSGQCHRDLRRGAGGGGGEQPAMTATGCFFSAEHQHNVLHKSGEYHHHLLLLYNLIYKLMILRVSEDCVWNLREKSSRSKRTHVSLEKERTIPSPFNRKKSSARSKRKMCLWRKRDISITIQ